jgi:hypothetical protein
MGKMPLDPKGFFFTFVGLSSWVCKSEWESGVRVLLIWAKISVDIDSQGTKMTHKLLPSLLLIFVLLGCSAPTPTPAPTPTATVVLPTDTPAPLPSPTLTPTATPNPRFTRQCLQIEDGEIELGEVTSGTILFYITPPIGYLI